MKKLLSLLLCVVICTASFISCDLDPIEKAPDQIQKYEDMDTKEESPTTLNFYIVVDDTTDDAKAAQETVKTKIVSYMLKKYNINLNINFCAADEYEASLNNAVYNDTINCPKCGKEIKYDESLNLSSYVCSACEEAVSNSADSESTCYICGKINEMCEGHKNLGDTFESMRADIVLVNSANLFDKYYSNNFDDNKFVELTDLYSEGNFYRLVGLIDTSLLEASKIYKVKESSNDSDDAEAWSEIYSVPNNHRIGSYEYIVINKDFVKHTLNIPESTINGANEIVEYDTKGYVTNHIKGENTDSFATILEAFAKYYESHTDEAPTFDEFTSKYLTIVRNGKKEDQDILSNDSENYVLVSSSPIATREEAFSSAYAIVKNLTDKEEIWDTSKSDYAENYITRDILSAHYSKCMQVIYSLNSDSELKNMLQYGLVETNYKLKTDKTGVKYADTEGLLQYVMNNVHTGNIYNAYYFDSKESDELDWTPDIMAAVKLQNSESLVYATEPIPVPAS